MIFELNRITRLIAGAASIAGAALSACSFAPPYAIPKSVEAPPAYQELTGWAAATPMDSIPRGAWWTLFADPQLDDLETRVGGANQNLQAAFARLQQARADTRIARADLFPSLDLTTSATRARVSLNSPRFPQGVPNLGNDFVLEADFSYEVDLWGRVRNQVASAQASQQASAADLASIDLSLRAELAGDYFSLRSLDSQIVILDKTVEDYAKSLELTQNLFSGGAAAISDVAQAEAQLQNARTQAADTRLQRAQMEHAIATLIGENPSVFRLPSSPLPPETAPPPIETGLPSDLLQRRPDVAQAERRVAAANAQIGVARAAYFPQFTLSAAAGYNSTKTTNWIDAPSRFWSFGPQVTLPLFEGGRLVAQTARTQAVYAEQVATYRNAVLTAYQDVEDNLAALRQLAAENESETLAVKATDTALRQARYRYTAGIVTFLEVATSETAALQAQLSAINIQTRRMNASVLLIKALGGGWDVHAPVTGANASLDSH